MFFKSVGKKFPTNLFRLINYACKNLNRSIGPGNRTRNAEYPQFTLALLTMRSARVFGSYFSTSKSLFALSWSLVEPFAKAGKTVAVAFLVAAAALVRAGFLSVSFVESLPKAEDIQLFMSAFLIPFILFICS